MQTGRFNYTTSAHQRNAENVIVLRKQPTIGAVYSDEWQRFWQEANDYGPRY